MKQIYILLFLMSSVLTAQTLNFTIDTAVDNGTVITETIVSGPDTYVLTVNHSGNEELDNLGGGDLVFFLSAIDPLTPHRLTITKNGMPTNFNLNSIDYDTLGAGTISVTNQDNAFISNPTAYPLGAGALTITNAANALSITQINIIPSDTDDLNDFGFHNINVDIVDTLSTDEVSSLEQSIDILPNPSDGNITIKNAGVALDKVVVSDLNGRTIVTYNLEGTTSDKNLDMSSLLSTGLYLVTISSESNAITKKLSVK
ncbi:T9SS type A sorting domain-containing protein [uncultured Psychroserpens sp.]|uniref:T9SS type A sorting domain-containing protein n=1 Tax=uncultured Psychroserpens sp. TaxID=255436 RepID=UPI002626A498|nr:T9SS type A sorting domain-containing protein [uncultured Psychroserpens sp.]